MDTAVRRGLIATAAVLVAVGVAGCSLDGSSGGGSSKSGRVPTEQSLQWPGQRDTEPVVTDTTTTTAEDSSTKSGSPITIAWAGDITPGSKYGLPPNRGIDQFASVAPQLRKADIAIGNLEGTLGSGGSSKCGSDGGNCFAFQAPAEFGDGLASAGFDVMNLANNHALDYGPVGQAETVAALDGRNIAHTGRPGEVATVTRKGVKVAVLGFAPYKWAGPLLDIPAASAQIREAAGKADIVIAVIHAGAEGSDRTHVPAGSEDAYGEDRGSSRAFAHAVIDAGADLVIGSGPHVVRGVEVYKQRVIAYSAGNFAGYNNFGLDGNLGLSAIVNVTIDPSGRSLAGKWTAVQIVGPGTPKLDPSGQSTDLVRSLSKEDFGASAAAIDSSGAFVVK